ncbi:hypothetical protein JCM30760_20090 [Thiomicrorhabdus hydrogeniphila]
MILKNIMSECREELLKQRMTEYEKRMNLACAHLALLTSENIMQIKHCKYE